MNYYNHNQIDQIVNPKGEYFRFSPGTLKKWIMTKKSPKKWGHLNSPGLFQTDRGNEELMMLFIFLLEVICLGITVSAIPTESLFPRIFMLALALLIIIADVFSAILSHKGHFNKIIFQNIAVVEDNNVEIDKIKNTKELKLNKFSHWIGIGLLAFLVLIKSSAFFLFATSEGYRALLFIIILLYAIAAFLHYTYTGFVWANIVMRTYFKKDYEGFSNNSKNDTIAQWDKQEIFSHEPLNVYSKHNIALIECSYELSGNILEVSYQDIDGTTKVFKTNCPDNLSDTPYFYILKVLGILTDSKIDALSREQVRNSQKDTIAVHCIKKQLQQSGI